MATPEMNCYDRLCRTMLETRARSPQFTHAEGVLAITMVALLVLAACALGRVGLFASFDYSRIIGFSCIGLSASLLLIKAALSSLVCCESSLRPRGTVSSWRTNPNVVITPANMANARAV